MAKKQLPGVDLGEIKKQNPLIDANQVVQALKAVETLRQQGLGGPEYNLGSPFTRRVPQPANLYALHPISQCGRRRVSRTSAKPNPQSN